MQLTRHTDYSLRVLIYLGLKADGWATVSELSEFYAVSRNHLVKVVHHLAQQQLIVTQRGKNGGMRLARLPEHIKIGDVIRVTEPNFYMAECFESNNKNCVLLPNCALKSILYGANIAFLAALNHYSILDAMTQSENVYQLINIHSDAVPLKLLP
uniref:HTH-type transcriptional regulator nsrR n=1 Tax=mine drainage metagenome TaxID=410659 RepID=E6QPM3_9ZZZZ